MTIQTATFWIATSLSLLAMTTGTAFAAINIPFTINLSETVAVTGTPRIAVDVGGNTRYATYTSGTGTNALIFTLSPNIGDVDLDGVTVSSPIDLNGGTIKDTSGNDATLTFTPPNTSGIKINYPSLGMDFTNGTTGRYTLNGTVYNDFSSFLTASGGTFVRNSVATYYDSTGLLQTVSNNTPRFDYAPVTHQPKGILIEESRTNLLNYSMTFNNSPWNLARSNIQLAATTSPDGTMNAVKLYNNGVAGGSYASYVRNYQANQIYTYSVYAKKAELPSINLRVYTAAGWAADGDVVFDLNAGTTTVNGTGVSSYKITALPNGWYRCSITATFGAVNQTGQYPIILINGPTDGVSGAYLYGAQLEQGAYATSYIPTTTTSVTRAADTFTLTSAPWSSTNGREAVFAQLDAQIPQPSWASIFTPGLFFSGNRYLLLGSNGTISGGYSGANITTTAIASSLTSFKAGTSFTSTNTYTALNGSVTTGPLVGSSSPATTGIGVGDVKHLNGHLQILKYYPLPLSGTQLQLLTQ